jgi:hypothetical protein
VRSTCPFTRSMGAPLMVVFSYGSRPFGPLNGLETCMVLNVGVGGTPEGVAPPMLSVLSSLCRLCETRPRRSWLDGQVCGRPVYGRPRPVGHPKAPPLRDSPGGSASEALFPLHEGNGTMARSMGDRSMGDHALWATRRRRPCATRPEARLRKPFVPL